MDDKLLRSSSRSSFFMDSAKQGESSEFRIATVLGVSSSPMDEGNKDEGGRDWRMISVVLEDGEEIPCDRVRMLLNACYCVCARYWGLCVLVRGLLHSLSRCCG